MKMIRNIALAGCSLALLTQCATQDEVQNLQFQLRAMNQKLENVKSTTVNQMQRRQASSVSKLDRVEDETLRIRSNLEENNSQTTMFRDQVRQDIVNLQAAVDNNSKASEAKVSELEQRVGVLEEKLATVVQNFTKIQQDRIAEAERRAQAAAERAKAAKQRAAAASASATMTMKSPTVQTTGELPTGRLVRLGPSGTKTRIAVPPRAVEESPAPQTTSTRQATTSVSPAQQTKAPVKQVEPKQAAATTPEKAVASSGSDSFSKGMSEFKGKNYKSAYKSFEQSLTADPNGAQVGKTLYYMGESLYNQGEYDLAILDYQKVISNHSKDSHASSALLKQGMAFEKLTDNETAKIIYKKLLSDYPGSSEAAQAKERLNKL